MSRRRAAVLVDGGAPRPVHVYLTQDGRDGGAGTVTSPLGTWGGLVDRLRVLWAEGQRRAVVRVLGQVPRLDRASRRRIAELEALGMRLEFRSLDGGGR